MKIIKDNNMTNHIGAFYVKNDKELLWSIRSGATYDNNWIGQQCDRSYKCDLHFHDTELSWPIRSSVIIDENLIG